MLFNSHDIFVENNKLGIKAVVKPARRLDMQMNFSVFIDRIRNQFLKK